MQIQPVSHSLLVSNLNFNSEQKISRTNKFFNQKDTFQPAFKGYYKLFDTFSRVNFISDKKVEDVFGLLFNELVIDSKALKGANFNEIYKIYKTGGFRGLMHELWCANPSKNIEKLIEEAQQSPITLISKDENSLFEIFSMGRHGFFNILFDRKTAPYDTKLTFFNKDKSMLMEFGLDKRGRCQLCQTRPSETIYTTFHRSTGNRKIVATHSKIGGSETEYYKKDGSSDSFKNFIQGGTVISPMF